MTDVRITERFEVVSADATPIAVWADGSGPALVMVHGSLQDHRASGALVEALRDEVTTYSIDRRGFGASGDSPEYSIEREFEDVAGVVDAVAARTAEPVALWGHSYGAGVAMGAAARTTNVHHLVLYEPALGLSYPEGFIESVERSVASGDHERALLTVLVGLAGMTDDEVAKMRANPFMPWEERLATVPTLPRECRAEEGWVYRAGQFDAVTAPALFLAGSESPPAVAEATRTAVAALPDSSVHVLTGHGHFAHRADPVMVGTVIRRFAWP